MLHFVVGLGRWSVLPARLVGAEVPAVALRGRGTARLLTAAICACAARVLGSSSGRRRDAGPQQWYGGTMKRDSARGAMKNNERAIK